MRSFLIHLRARLGVVIQSPFTILTLLLLGVSSLMMWPSYSINVTGEESRFIEIFLRFMMIWMFPFFAAIFITGWMGSTASAGWLSAQVLPALPVSTRTRILAEATGGLLLLLLPRVLAILVLPLAPESDSLFVQAWNIEHAWRHTWIGALVCLPVLIACCSPAEKNWFHWTRSFVVAMILSIIAMFGFMENLGLVAAISALLTIVLLLSYRVGPGFGMEILQRKDRHPVLHRTGIDPSDRFRRDLWELPLRKFWPILGITAMLSFLAPPIVAWLGISEMYFAMTAGIIPGLAIFMLNFPMGVHIFNGEKGLGAPSGMRGTLQGAWAHLPVHRSQVTRGIWNHGMVGGLLFWSMFVSHFLLMMYFAGEWDGLVWFHISMILAIPALAGFLVGGAVGDKFLNAVSILSLIAIPFLDFGVTRARSRRLSCRSDPAGRGINRRTGRSFTCQLRHCAETLEKTGRPADRRGLKENKMFKKVVYYLVVLIITFNQSTPLLGSSGLSAEQRALNVASFDLVWTTVRDKHFDPELGGIDWNALGEKYRTQLETTESMRDVRIVMSHFNILPREIIEDIKGVGEIRFREGSLGLEVVAVDGRALVVAVQENSSGAKAGIRTGWEILIAEGVETRSLLERIRNEFEHSTYFEYYSSAVVRRYLEGEIGQSVQLTFLDGDNNKVEQNLSMEKKTGWRLSIGNLPPVNVLFKSRLLERNIGYIGFSSFMDPLHLMPAYNKAMQSFMKADGVIIDLRGNGGGMAPIAMGMAGWLIPGKEHYLGTLHFRDAELKTIIYPRAKTYSGPVVFLVDGRSASCSELFSGGMKDLGRARIIGTTTAGAVLMSTFQKLPNGDALQYPFADYISRGGQALEGVGVKPHEIARHNQDDLLAGIDFPLTRAVAWITGQNNTKTIANEH